MAKTKKPNTEAVKPDQKSLPIEIKCKSFVKHDSGYILDLSMGDLKAREKSLSDIIQIRKDNGTEKTKVLITDGNISETVDIWVLNYYPWMGFLCFV